MRTTLTVADGLMAELKETAHRRGLPLRRVVEDALRAGLAGLERKRSSKPYRCPTFSLGPIASHADLDRTLALADRLEEDEVARELDLRK